MSHRARLERWLAQGGLWLACASLCAIGVWHAVIAPLSPLQRLEWAVDDLRQNAHLTSERHPDIVIVDIDEASLAELGRWPWPRHRLAQLLDELFNRQRVAAVGFDLVFPEPDEGAWPLLQELAGHDAALARQLGPWRPKIHGDLQFARALQGRQVVLGYYLSADRGGVRVGPLPEPLLSIEKGAPQPRLPRWTGWGGNVSVLAQAAPHAGFFNAWPDADGVVRAVPAVGWVDQQLQPSLSLALARMAAGQPEAQAVWKPLPGHPDRADLAAIALTSADGGHSLLPLDELGRLRVRYLGTGGKLGGAFEYVSAADLIARRMNVAQLAGKLILVGSSAPGLADLRPTPVHPAMPGVEVHANLLAAMLDGELPQRPDWAPGYEVALTVLAVASATLIASRLAGGMAMVSALALFSIMIVANMLAYGKGWVLPIAAPLSLAAGLFLGAVSISYVREWEGRRSLVRLFSSYLPPDRARELARDPQVQTLQAENRELTILFCDLRGFTTIAEDLPPLALRDLLNQYLSTATRIVHQHGGTLDKFIGDAVMAFWGAPQVQADHASRAVAAALALAEGTAELNATLKERGLPAVGYGIGLASGVVCVGDLGSSARRAYTAVGDAVNLAARLEALTRDTGVDILVSESTCQAAASRSDIVWVEVTHTRVKGRQQSVKLFTPLSAAGAESLQSQDQLRIWQLALEASQQQHVALARSHLVRLNELLNLNHAVHPEGGAISATSPSHLEALLTRLSARLAARLNQLDASAAQSGEAP